MYKHAIVVAVAGALLRYGWQVGVPDARPSVPVGTATCPPDQPKTRKAVIKFLTSSGAFAADRAQLGLTSADTTNLRILVDSTDAVACQWFRDQVTLSTNPPRDWAFYQTRGFYFVPMVPMCDTPCLMHGALAIFDTTFALRKTRPI